MIVLGIHISTSSSAGELLCVSHVVEKVEPLSTTISFSAVLHSINHFNINLHIVVVSGGVKVLTDVLSEEPVILSCSLSSPSTNT